MKNMRDRSDWPVIVVSTAGTNAADKPVVIGVPFPSGKIVDPSRLNVHTPDGSVLPTACRTLVAWPDGSTRWALVSFEAPITGNYTLQPDQGGAPVAPAGICTQQTSDQVVLDNGLIQVVLSTRGAGPISRMTAFKRDIVKEAADFLLIVDDADSTHEKNRTIRVLENSAIRTRVRISGGHFTAAGQRKLNYRLDLELWAGWPTLRLDYQFFNLEPGQDAVEIRRIACECRVALDPAQAQRHFSQRLHGIFYQSREVLNPSPVGIVVDTERVRAHVEDPAMLLDNVQYPEYLAPPLVTTHEWLGVTGGDLSVHLQMQDFINMPPKRMVSAGRSLALEAWPEFAGVLALPQGRTRRQVFALACAVGPRPDAAGIQNASTALFWEGRANVHPDWLAQCGEYEQDRVLPFGRHGRFEKYLARLTAVITPNDMFDLGDTPDTGYCTSYPSQGRRHVRLLPNAPDLPRRFNATNGVIGMLSPWILHQLYERVWVNNEYDGIHAIACELMRTGKPGLWPMLRWLTRHNIEVDFIHYSDHVWLNRISAAHSARHASSGGYPSHFWTQGLLEYYCLTGDVDVLEVAMALGDAIIRFFHDPERGQFYNGFDREIGWSFLALVHLYDITRERRYADEIDRLIEFCKKQKPVSDDSAPVFHRSHIQRFYFMLNLVEGMDLYQRITGREDVAAWLLHALKTMPAQVKDLYREGGSGYSMPAALAIGYERTGDLEFLKTGLLCIENLVMDEPHWHNPSPEVKPMAVCYRAVIRYLGHAWRAGLLDRFEYTGLRAE